MAVEGTAAGPSPWPGLAEPGPHWITPCRQVDSQTYQSYPSIIRSKSGALTAAIPFGNPNAGEVRRTVWVRSPDGGRSWSEAEPAALQQGFATSFVRQDGTWVCVNVKYEETSLEKAFYTYESPDEGHTWQGPRPWVSSPATVAH